MKAITWKYSCAMKAVSMLISYDICPLAWIMSGFIENNYTSSSSVTAEFLSWKEEKGLSNSAVSLAYVWMAKDALRTWRCCSASSSQSLRHSIDRSWNISSTDVLPEALTSVLSVSSLAAGAAAVWTHVKNLFTGSSRKWNFDWKAHCHTARQNKLAR